MLYENLETLKKYESEKGRSIREIPLEKVIKHVETGADPSLITVKAIDTVIRGAEAVEGLWRKCARVVQMTQPKQEFPVVGYTDFKVYKGRTASAAREAGGYFDRIELDCSSGRGMRKVAVSIPSDLIRDVGFNIVEEALEMAGYVMADEVLGSIIYEYENDVDSSMTDTLANWGNDHYKALVIAVSKIAAQRMTPDIVLIHPDEMGDLLQKDYFIHGQYSQLAGKQQYQPEQGLAAYLFPNKIPIYYSPKVTAGKMIVAASQKAVIVGVRQDLTIENFNDILKGEKGGVVTMQWDTKSGKDAQKTKPTAKAWAVVTSA